MAKTKNSILDGIRGRVGPLSFSVNKGGNYVKLRKKSVNPKTAAQVAQQNRFRNNAGGWNPLTQAIKQADSLVSELKFRGVDSFRVDIEGDPGGMSESEAKYLVKQLIN